MTIENPSLRVIEGTRLWQSTLAPSQGGNPSLESQKELLRNTFISMRAKVANIVRDVSRDLPYLTYHDVTHLDALWEMADLILDDANDISPLEAFIFGGAVLLHDAGLTLSAYKGRFGEIKTMPEWKDGVRIEFRRIHGRDPEADEIMNPPEEIGHAILQSILRENHARQAAVMVTQYWGGQDGLPRYHLIDENEIRLDLGPLIGELAYSHWWELPEVEVRFSQKRNPPSWCNHAGKVRPLILACLLRCADAIHLDSRRAPRFARARMSLPAGSRLHWEFQERLDAPTREGDSVYFTGGVFQDSHYDAWWLCYEVLCLANKELEGCHALLSDKNLPVFAVRRVHSINDVARLSLLIKTDGWTPVDAPVRISNVAGVVMELGGRALYGDSPWVVIRELIQNAADATRARRAVENRPSDWGEILISYDESKGLLSIRDCGIGMTEFVIKNFLLDFFKSFWTSATARKDLKGHVGSIGNTGRFGIGFFSVFMISKSVKVTTRSALFETSKSMVVEFKHGYRDRPILRFAKDSEKLFDPGTLVELELMPDMVFSKLSDKTGAKSMKELAVFIAPALDVDLCVKQDDQQPGCAVKANDWRSIDGLTLLKRIDNRFSVQSRSLTHNIFGAEIDFNDRLVGSLSDFKKGEKLVGRLALVPDVKLQIENTIHTIGSSNCGIITNGGLRVGKLSGFAGIMDGDVIDASRKLGYSKFTEESIQDWVLEQEAILKRNYAENPIGHDCKIDDALLMIASALSYLGNKPIRTFPVCKGASEKSVFLDDLPRFRDFETLFFSNYFPKTRRDRIDLQKEEMFDILKSGGTDGAWKLFSFEKCSLAPNVLVFQDDSHFMTFLGIRAEMRFETVPEKTNWGRLLGEENADDRNHCRFASQWRVLEELERLSPGFEYATEYQKELEVPTADNGTANAEGFLVKKIKKPA